MSKLAEILKIENAPRETPVQKRTVHLVRMGAFIRAYDWSAWLLKRYGSPLNVGLDHLRSSLSSMLGLMRQHSSYNLRQNLIQGRLHPESPPLSLPSVGERGVSNRGNVHQGCHHRLSCHRCPHNPV